MNKINFNWQERFKNMRVDNKSKAKNFIRFDWTDSAVKKKDEFNKNVDAMIGRITETQSKYNVLVDVFDETNSAYQADLALAQKAASEAEKSPDSLQSKILSCRKILSSLKRDFQTKSSQATSKIPKYSRSITIYDSYTGRINAQLSSLNSRILRSREELSEYNAKKKVLDQNFRSVESDISRLQSSISSLVRERSALQNPSPPHGSRNAPNRQPAPPVDQRRINQLSTQITSFEQQKRQKETEKRQLSESITKCNQHISTQERELKKIDDEVHTFNQSQFYATFSGIEQFTRSKISEIDQALVRVNQYQKRQVKQEAANARIATSIAV